MIIFNIHLKSYFPVPGDRRKPEREGGRQWHPAILRPADRFVGSNKKLGWNGPRIHGFLQRRPGAAFGICFCWALHSATSVQVGLIKNPVLIRTVPISVLITGYFQVKSREEQTDLLQWCRPPPAAVYSQLWWLDRLHHGFLPKPAPDEFGPLFVCLPGSISYYHRWVLVFAFQSGKADSILILCAFINVFFPFFGF